MFGYVRPEKADLLVREFSRYRSVYCGLCKEIGRTYGQLPRIATGYDLTFLALLLIALSDETTQEDAEGCILNPVVKKPVLKGGAALPLCAALSVLLAYYKADDDVRDAHSVKGWLARLAMFGAYRKARRAYPAEAEAVRSAIGELSKAEKAPPDPAAAEIFGHLLGTLFGLAADRCVPPPPEDSPSDGFPYDRLHSAMERLGAATGRWIFLLDAFDDIARDEDNGAWNALAGLPRENVRETAENLLLAAEEDADRTAALLPYRRDAGVVGNIMRQGLPGVRNAVFAGRKLGRL
jgi:hypothetical protein